MALDRLIKNILEKKNPTVAGLDPKLDFIPEFIKEQAFAEYGCNLEGAAEALLTSTRGSSTRCATSSPRLSLSALIMRCTAGRG